LLIRQFPIRPRCPQGMAVDRLIGGKRTSGSYYTALAGSMICPDFPAIID
jgi:hypothetical protein